MPHSFPNSERTRRQIKELVEQKRKEQEQAEQPSGKSKDQPLKATKKKKRAR